MNQTGMKHETVSARRTHILLQKTLLDQLAASPLERITLTDICSASMVPRSTFYRYFDDKYDLLNYCLKNLVEEANLTDEAVRFKNMDSFLDFLMNLINHIDQSKALFQKIYMTNKDGELIPILRVSMIRIISNILHASEENGAPKLKISYPIFTTLLTDFYFSIIRCYLELGNDYDIKSFVDDACLFANKDFFLSEET